MLRDICSALSRDPTDTTVYIYAVSPQVLERESPHRGYSGDSILRLLLSVLGAGLDFFDPRRRALFFHSLRPHPPTRVRAAVQPMAKRVEDEEVDATTAARLNRPDLLRRLVQREGTGALCARDDAGHTPAHWAALEGHTDVIDFLAAAGGPVDLPSEHPLRQRPIHWAAVNGHIATMERLLATGVCVDVVDAQGCTPLITACQYGQTSAAAFLMGRGAQLQACDKEGDNALHWAAFRGRPELVRLLIYSGFNAHQRDSQGQGALHLAAISGDLSTVRDLCRIDRVNVHVTDANGRTPLMLAKGRRHDDVSAFLSAESGRREGGLWSRIDLKSLAFGPPGRKREAQLLFMFICAVLLYPAYLLKVAPALWGQAPGLNLLFLLLNGLAALAFVYSSIRDPGFLPTGQPEYDRVMRQVGSFEAWSRGGESVLDRLCHTCRLVKPLRAKHCRVCDRCVQHMDHHCPYIYNCVGAGNRGWFFAFIYATLGITALSFHFAYLLLSERGFDLIILLLLPIGLFGLSVTGAVGLCLWHNAARNITTNELANRHRYSYLRSRRGGFRNPFDRGMVTNLLEFFHLRSSPLFDYQMQRVADIL